MAGKYGELLGILWDFTLPDEERIKAAEQLYGTGNEDLSITFVELLKLDPSPLIRLSAVKALGKVGKVSTSDVKAANILKKIILHDRDPMLRAEAEVALEQIRLRYESSRGNARRNQSKKRKEDSRASKSSDSSKTDRSILINSELVSELLKGPG